MSLGLPSLRMGVLSSGLAGVLMLAACANRGVKKEAWREGGTQLGTITSLPRPYGFEYQYHDLSKQLVRVERRDASRTLVSGACTLKIARDPAGRPAEERHLDASGAPALSSEGFAYRRWTYSTDENGNSVTSESFLDTREVPVATCDGFSVLRTTRRPDGSLKKLEFFNAHGESALSRHLGVQDVTEVQFVQLQGVGTVECAVFLGPGGRVIERRQLKGLTEVHSTSGSTYYNPCHTPYSRPYYRAVPR